MTDLRKREPVEVSIPPKLLFGGILTFAIVFWIIGSIFRYYVPVGV